MIKTYRGQEYDISSMLPESYLLDVIDAETAATSEERQDARERVEAVNAEIAAFMPQIAAWNNR